MSEIEANGVHVDVAPVVGFAEAEATRPRYDGSTPTPSQRAWGCLRSIAGLVGMDTPPTAASPPDAFDDLVLRVEAVVGAWKRVALSLGRAKPGVVAPPPAPSPIPMVESIHGGICPTCGGMTKRAGTCEVCLNCGETTGCG